MNNKELPLGTIVYYSLEDYDSGDEIIYTGKILDIYDKDITFPDGSKSTIHLYKIDDGLSMQRNAFYTLPELFQLKDRLQFIQTTMRGDINEYLSVYRESNTN